MTINVFKLYIQELYYASYYINLIVRHLGGLRFRSKKALQESSLQSLQEYQELQPQNRRTFEAESSRLSAQILKFTGIKPKVFENINKSQISEALQIQAFKVPKIFHHKPSKTKNTKNVNNKGFLTSSQPEIHCNSVSAIFDPSLNQIEGYFVFKSKSHYHKSNQ